MRPGGKSSDFKICDKSDYAVGRWICFYNKSSYLSALINPVMEPKETIAMKSERFKSFNYAIGMFGTSIPINMLKTYAAIFYVDQLGLKTTQWAMILFIYTFIDALDNPVYGFLSDRTRSKWGRRRPAAGVGVDCLL